MKEAEERGVKYRGFAQLKELVQRYLTREVGAFLTAKFLDLNFTGALIPKIRKMVRMYHFKMLTDQEQIEVLTRLIEHKDSDTERVAGMVFEKYLLTGNALDGESLNYATEQSTTYLRTTRTLMNPRVVAAISPECKARLLRDALHVAFKLRPSVRRDGFRPRPDQPEDGMEFH